MRSSDTVNDTDTGAPRIAAHQFVWTWAGELDAADVKNLRERWQSLRGQAGGVVIDLGQVTFIDCAILALLVTAHREAPSLVLRAAPTAVLRLLQVFELEGLLEAEVLTT